MHAAGQILQKSLAQAFKTMHSARVKVLLGALGALILGRRLVLMDLARAWPDAARVRRPLQKLDRLLGNPHLHAEQQEIYAVMAQWLLNSPRPIIVLDGSDLQAHGKKSRTSSANRFFRLPVISRPRESARASPGAPATARHLPAPLTARAPPRSLSPDPPCSSHALLSIKMGEKDAMGMPESPAAPALACTPLQGQYLAFLYAYTRLHRRAPAEADLQQHFAVTAPSVHQMLLTPERQGFIRRTPRTARNITLLVPPNLSPATRTVPTGHNHCVAVPGQFGESDEKPGLTSVRQSLC